MKMHLIDISRPQGVLWEGGTLSRSLACGSTTRYYLATPDGVCSSHHSELLIPNYTLLRPLAGRRTIARSGALARLRDIATPTFQDPSWVARGMHIGAMGRRRAGAPEVCRLSENPVRCPPGRVRGQKHRIYMSPGGTMSSHTRGIAWRQRHSRTEPYGGVSNVAPCKRGRAARSLGYQPHPQQIAAEQQINQSQICYAVATSLKLTFYPTLHGALHRLHGATSDTVLRTSWLPCSSPLRVASGMHIGAMGRRQSRTEPHGGSLINNPTLTRQRLCGENDTTLIYNAVGVAFIHEATKQHLRRCFAPSSHLPHIVAALQCGAIYKATARRLALNHENSLIY